MAARAARSQALPVRWTARTALVLGVMAASTDWGQRLALPGSESAKTGMAPWVRMGMMVPMSVMEVVMTSSPGEMAAAMSAAWREAVPLEQATAKGMLKVCAARASRALTFLPWA